MWACPLFWAEQVLLNLLRNAMVAAEIARRLVIAVARRKAFVATPIDAPVLARLRFNRWIYVPVPIQRVMLEPVRHLAALARPTLRSFGVWIEGAICVRTVRIGRGTGFL
jgi:hypothetical protein